MAHDRVLTGCLSMRNLDGSSTLDYIDCCMDYYACGIPQHTFLVQLLLAQRNSLSEILNSSGDHYGARMYEINSHLMAL